MDDSRNCFEYLIICFKGHVSGSDSWQGNLTERHMNSQSLYVLILINQNLRKKIVSLEPIFVLEIYENSESIR